MLNLFLGFCGGSDPDPPHASQQPRWHSQRGDAGAEGRGQPHPLTGADVDLWLFHVGTRQGVYALPFLGAQQPGRSGPLPNTSGSKQGDRVFVSRLIFNG